MQMPVALELVQNKHPLLINVPASLLLQDGTDADLRLRLFIISSRECCIPIPASPMLGGWPTKLAGVGATAVAGAMVRGPGWW